MSNVLIVDDHPLCIFALSHILSPLFDHTLSAASAEDGLRIVRSGAELKFLLLDVVLPGMNGIEALAEFRKLRPDLPIAIVSASEDRRDVAAALKAGAHMFISKGASATAILGAVGKLIACDPAAPRTVLPAVRNTELESALPELSARQARILSLLSKGKSNREIGTELSLAEPTIKMHISALFRVLSVANRTQAVLLARRYSLVSEEHLRS